MIWTFYTNYAHADLFSQQAIVRAEQNVSNLIQVFILRWQDINIILLVCIDNKTFQLKKPSS
jgi:hypothetical protein